MSCFWEVTDQGFYVTNLKQRAQSIILSGSKKRVLFPNQIPFLRYPLSSLSICTAVVVSVTLKIMFFVDKRSDFARNFANKDGRIGQPQEATKLRFIPGR